MFRDTKELLTVLVKLKSDTDDNTFIKIIAYAIEEVLSLNDFNTLVERLKDDIE